MFSTAGSVFAAVTWPLIVGAVLLTAFLLSVGWFRALFARQPLRGRWWMWIAPALIVITLVMRYVGIDYSVYPGSAIAMTLVTGLFIGFVEEVLTRGIVVKMLRDAGTSEWLVMLGSSLAFGLMHGINLFSGMSPLVVGITVFFAFGFGILMYVTLRVTGNLIWPILLHALYDPTLFLSTGGIDVATARAQSVLVTLARLGEHRVHHRGAAADSRGDHQRPSGRPADRSGGRGTGVIRHAADPRACSTAAYVSSIASGSLRTTTAVGT